MSASWWATASRRSVAVVVRHVHGGPVGEVRHGQVRHLLQRAFVIHHARQGGARLGQKAGGLLGPLLLVDVGAGPEPAGDLAIAVVDGHGSDEMPAVGLLPPIQQPHFHLERSAASHGSRPPLAGGRGVVGVQDRPPAVVAHRLRQAGELGPAAVQVVDVAVRSGGPDDLRHGVGKLAEPLFALPQDDLGPLPLAHVPEVDGQPVRRRVGMALVPAVVRRVEKLERDGDVLGHRTAVVPLHVGSEGVGILLPMVLADQVVPTAAQQHFRLPVDVGEPPVPVQGAERIGDALQDRAGLRLGSLRLLFGPLAGGDVFVNQDDFPHPAFAVLERVDDRRQPAAGVVLPGDVRNRLVRVVLNGRDAGRLTGEALMDVLQDALGLKLPVFEDVVAVDLLEAKAP